MSTDKNNNPDWVMVPREPTEAMVEAARIPIACRRDCTVSKATAKDAYRAMIAAAPQPQPSRDREEGLAPDDIEFIRHRIHMKEVEDSSLICSFGDEHRMIDVLKRILSLTGVGFSARDHDLTASGANAREPK